MGRRHEIGTSAGAESPVSTLRPFAGIGRAVLSDSLNLVVQRLQGAAQEIGLTFDQSDNDIRLYHVLASDCSRRHPRHIDLRNNPYAAVHDMGRMPSLALTVKPKLGIPINTITFGKRRVTKGVRRCFLDMSPGSLVPSRILEQPEPLEWEALLAERRHVRQYTHMPERDPSSFRLRARVGQLRGLPEEFKEDERAILGFREAVMNGGALTISLGEVAVLHE